MTVPKETLTQSNLNEDEARHRTAAPKKLRLPPRDSDLEDQIETARGIMERRRRALHRLAK